MTTREKLAADIGRKDEVDEHPLICCAPHILNGHAHLKSRRVVIERVLAALLKERLPGPLYLDATHKATAATVSNEEVKAVYRYTIDVFQKISHLYAELDRRNRLLEGMAKGNPKSRV